MTEEENKSRRIKASFVIIVLIFLIVVAGFSWLVTDVQDVSHKNTILLRNNIRLNRENEARIAEIQASRIASCMQTYNGIREVFQPFFPPPPRTQEQKDNLAKFNAQINKLLHGCVVQTKPKP